MQIVTWLCAGGDLQRQPTLLRFVSKDGTPLFRFEDAVPEPAGLCYSLSDRVATLALDSGTYTYHVRWNEEEGDVPLEEQASFENTPALDTVP